MTKSFGELSWPTGITSLGLSARISALDSILFMAINLKVLFEVTGENAAVDLVGGLEDFQRVDSSSAALSSAKVPEICSIALENPDIDTEYCRARQQFDAVRTNIIFHLLESTVGED
jgi:hypothetical protein